MKKELYVIELKRGKDDPNSAITTIFEDKSVEVSSSDQGFATYLKSYLEEILQNKPVLGLRGGGRADMDEGKAFVTTYQQIKFGEPGYGDALAYNIVAHPENYEGQRFYAFVKHN